MSSDHNSSSEATESNEEATAREDALFDSSSKEMEEAEPLVERKTKRHKVAPTFKSPRKLRASNLSTNVHITIHFYMKWLRTLADDKEYLKCYLWPLLEALFCSPNIPSLCAKYPEIVIDSVAQMLDKRHNSSVYEFLDVVAGEKAVDEGEGCGKQGCQSEEVQGRDEVFVMNPRAVKQKVALGTISGVPGEYQFHGQDIPGGWWRVDVRVVLQEGVSLMFPNKKGDQYMIEDAKGSPAMWREKNLKLVA